MAYTPKILAFAGSLRKDSFNKKLVKLAAAGAKSAGADVTYIDLKELPMPIFDEDLEAAQGMPCPSPCCFSRPETDQGRMPARARRP